MTPDDMDMHVIYDVSHNIAKIEEHIVDGKPKTLCVHRKGATRAFPPHHPLIPVDYQVSACEALSSLIGHLVRNILFDLADGATSAYRWHHGNVQLCLDGH